MILVNCAPSETFVDIPGREAFDSYREYLDIYWADRIIPELDRPRISIARLVPDTIERIWGFPRQRSKRAQP